MEEEPAEVLLGGVEAGGTTFVACIASSSAPSVLLARAEFPTDHPDSTISAVAQWLSQRPVAALGIASFGPVDLEPSSPRFGCITSTPKPAWANTDLLGKMRAALGLDAAVPVRMQTDVNAPALSEQMMGNHGVGVNSVCYITVGTGVGCGITTGGAILKGFGHAEAGHIRVGRAPGEVTEFQGICPFHQDCIEGLVSSGAIAKRLGIKASELKNVSELHPVWDIVAWYLGNFCQALTLIASPQVIVCGGGVFQCEGLLEKVRAHFQVSLNGYVQIPPLEKYIVRSRFKGDAGAVGALNLAYLAWKETCNGNTK